KALVLASGYGLHPFLMDKLPYFNNRSYTGLYAPNPYFDRDLSAVKVPGRFGLKRSKRMITKSVPASLADLPQYRNGMWSFVDGHRPKF
ncbi:MAG: type IV secretory system conjugative DNA transfer family protein, partial [Pseudomonadota bacterium]